MSFFKKLKDEFDGMSGSKDRDVGSQQQYSGQGGYQQGGQYPPQDPYNRPPPQHQPSYGSQQPPYGHQQSYGTPDPYSQQQSSYHQPPPLGYGGSPAPQYGGSPAPYGERPRDYGAPPVPSAYPPPGGERPPVPNQWVPIYSEQLQRWYFIETTGRSLWEAPVFVPPQPPMPAYGDYAGSRGGGADYGAPAGPPPGGMSEYRGQEGEYVERKEEKDNSNRNMMLAAAGGLAVGAVGAAVVADALDDSDDEHRAPPPPPAEEYGGAPPAPSGPTDAWGNPISEDDRESVASAREEYQEQLNDSSASSSDVEEAREEYQEELEEAYYDE